jgi:DUF4097 and DUF4098 domain-containing protein YvlB
MFIRGWLRLIAVLLAFLCLASTPHFAQRSEKEERGLNCNQNWNSDRASHCVIKEQTIPASGAIDVDGKKNGGVSVKGWDRNEIFIRSQIQTWANTEAEAQAVATQIRIETAGGKIHAEGPAMEGRQGWAVSYEIFVPRNTNLSLKAHNGGIGIADVRGQVDFDALNGGVSLRRLAGNVRGQTVNGGLSIELAGTRWDGEGMNVKTMNGGVNLVVPENYSARLETSTVNGGMRIDIPVTVQGKIEKELSIDLGSGGPTVRATTTNGGVSIKRKA